MQLVITYQLSYSSSPINARPNINRSLRTGTSTLPAAPPIKYVLGYRSRTLTLNRNPEQEKKHIWIFPPFSRSIEHNSIASEWTEYCSPWSTNHLSMIWPIIYLPRHLVYIEQILNWSGSMWLQSCQVAPGLRLVLQMWKITTGIVSHCPVYTVSRWIMVSHPADDEDAISWHIKWQTIVEEFIGLHDWIVQLAMVQWYAVREQPIIQRLSYGNAHHCSIQLEKYSFICIRYGSLCLEFKNYVGCIDRPPRNNFCISVTAHCAKFGGICASNIELVPKLTALCAVLPVCV